MAWDSINPALTPNQRKVARMRDTVDLLNRYAAELREEGYQVSFQFITPVGPGSTNNLAGVKVTRTEEL